MLKMMTNDDNINSMSRDKFDIYFLLGEILFVTYSSLQKKKDTRT